MRSTRSIRLFSSVALAMALLLLRAGAAEDPMPSPRREGRPDEDLIAKAIKGDAHAQLSLAY